MKNSLAKKPYQSSLTEQPLPHNGKIPEEGKIILINTSLLQEKIKSLTSKHCEGGKFSCGTSSDQCHRKVKEGINTHIPDKRINAFSSPMSIETVVKFAINACMGTHHLKQQER